jgi:tRNA A37 methylthiotransferase MiaB
MINEQKIRAHIRKILLEAERTRKGGQGRYKKEITQTGALAKSNPGELMKRLQVTSVTGKDDIEKMFDLLDKVTSAPTAMSQAYEKPLPRQDKGTRYMVH